MFTASVPQWRRDALVPPPHPPEWSLPLPASAPSIQDRRRPRVRGALSGAYHRGRGEPGAGLDPLQGTSVGPGGHPTLSEARALEGRHLCQRAWGAPPREAACGPLSFTPSHSFIYSLPFILRQALELPRGRERPVHGHRGSEVHPRSASARTASFQAVLLLFEITCRNICFSK